MKTLLENKKLKTRVIIALVVLSVIAVILNTFLFSKRKEMNQYKDEISSYNSTTGATTGLQLDSSVNPNCIMVGTKVQIQEKDHSSNIGSIDWYVGDSSIIKIDLIPGHTTSDHYRLLETLKAGETTITARLKDKEDVVIRQDSIQITVVDPRVNVNLSPVSGTGQPELYIGLDYNLYLDDDYTKK